MKLKNALTLFAIFLFSVSAFAQDKKDLVDVNLDDLIIETQFNLDAPGSDDIKLVWWIPSEFWGTIYAQDESIDDETADEIVSALDQYTMVIVVDGEITTMGSFKSKSEKVLRKNLSIYDEDGKEYTALEESEIGFETLMFMNILEPILANLLGKMGEGMEVLVFQKNDDKVLDPYEGSGQIVYEDNTIELDLPLSSLITDKTCPEDGEKMNPKWKFCPYHGTELE